MARRGLMGRIPIRVRAPGIIALVLAAGLVLGACNAAEGDGVASAGGEANPTAEDAEQGTLAEEVQALAFAECMRANGIDMPDPAPGQGGLSDAFHETEDNYDGETVEEALAACQDLLPQRTHAGGHDAAREEALLDMADCLREQGLEVPDNLQQQGGLLHDLDDDELRAAMEECRDVLTGGDHA
jgi:predicted small secreted protein